VFFRNFFQPCRNSLAVKSARLKTAPFQNLNADLAVFRKLFSRTENIFSEYGLSP
jgi:hypothetical protein